MSSQPKISVIIPVRNESEKVERCLEAVFNQTLKPFEVIAVDGHSTDNTVENARKFPVSMMHNSLENKVYSINGKDVIYFRDMIKIVLKQLGGFRFRVFLPVSLFLKFLMMSYQKLSGEIQFTPDQGDSLTAKEVFPNYPWWDEFDIEITSFEEGVKRMVEWNE